MKLVKQVICLMGVLLIAACSGAASNSTVDALNKAQAVGSPFTKTLAAEYRDYANMKQNQFMDHADALHFARKGLASASGVVVMPETLDDWDLSDKNIVDLTQARADLVDALENGGRELASDKAGVAQAKFDCWVEQQEESWSKDVPCKTQFADALKALQDVVGKKPVEEAFPAPVTEMPKGEPVAVEQAMFIVFFDWDKNDITASANDVLDAVAQEIRSRKDINGIVVVGHTDTSGGNNYNQKLSLRRAEAVKNGLIARGVDAAKLRAEGRGKTDLLVQTADGVREPANRRAQITLE
ncbi:MAG TPA: OmpA family protein [Alphaproteobacteria bacterium]|nr:OmpA family protein [Alphaproteobacteria bacterium]HCS24168.1 OmpA family protein [Rhodospirillaceae bacterium]HRI75456.1 OmpA family protein [Alphaproteobacteria bacterium]HRJ67652.1 OmpA family protein [Alphaproteobacteria bacterium]